MNAYPQCRTTTMQPLLRPPLQDDYRVNKLGFSSPVSCVQCLYRPMRGVYELPHRQQRRLVHCELPEPQLHLV